jgi:polyisoprenoid-binding protein YceI
MRHAFAISCLLGALASFPVQTTRAAEGDPPPATPDSAKEKSAGKGAVAEPKPPANLPAGTVVYRTLTGREAQATFTSEAPLERIVGKSNAIMGYALSGPKDSPAALAGATWVLPVESMATGLPLRDEHMVGHEWLDAETYPAITFTLTRVDDVKEVKRGDGFSTWSGTLVGTMTMHGVTKELRVADAKFSFLAASEKTKSIAPGDLFFLKCDYEVKLSDFGIKHPDVPQKVSDTVKLSQMLRMTNAEEGEKKGMEKGE